MKHNIKRLFPVILALGLYIIAFNAIAFLCAGDLSANFWSGYAFITVSWLCLSISIFSIYKRANDEYFMFLNAPSIVISAIYLVLQLVFGIAVMVIPSFSFKASLLIQIFFLAAYGIICALLTIYKTKSTNKMESIDRSRNFVQQSITDVEMICVRCTDAELSRRINTLREQLRYTDPISLPDTDIYEKRIAELIAVIRQSIYSDDHTVACAACDEACILVQQRAAVCATNKKH